MMKVFKFLHDNLFDDATITTSSAPVVGYPVANLTHEWYTKYFHTEGITSEWIKWHLTGSPSVQAFVIKGHNLQTSAVVRIQGNDSDAWTGSTDPILDDPIIITQDMVTRNCIPIIFDSALPHAWWRLLVSDDSPANPDGYLKFGRPFGGPYTELSCNFNNAYVIAQIDPSTVIESDGGQHSVNVRKKYKTLAYAWEDITLADRNILMDIFEELGIEVPYFICQDSDLPTTNTYYVRNTSDWSYSHVFMDNQFGFTLTVRESK